MKKAEAEANERLPLRFWFSQPEYLPVDPSLISDEARINIYWAGRHPPPDNLSLWDKRRRDLNIECDCGCIGSDVDECYDDWYKVPETLTSRLMGKNKGACDIIKKHFHHVDNYTPEALTVLEELIAFSKSSEESFREGLFLQNRYNLTYIEAMVILEHINKQGWYDHGSGARCSRLTKIGHDWLESRGSKSRSTLVPFANTKRQNEI
jgi:hypothetical protein